MSEELEKKSVTLQALKESFADLRYRVSDFQDGIEGYLKAVDDLWREAKSHLASIEARLAGMEVQLSTIPVDQTLSIEKLEEMLKDLDEVGQDLDKMRRRFNAFARGTMERVN
jgi:CRISPR/Cas system CSM-associated protein Csm2 small subunit